MFFWTEATVHSAPSIFSALRGKGKSSEHRIRPFEVAR